MLWRRPANYRFAAIDTVCPLMAHELPKAVLSLPVSFMRSNEKFRLFALQGLTSNQNLFVDDNGKWLGNYVPGVYRAYPFLLANAGSGSGILCVHEESDLIGEKVGKETFFEEDGKLSKSVEEIMNFLVELHEFRDATDRICSVLDHYGLIEPWPINIRRVSGDESISGFYRINESALNQLAPQGLQELRDCGALVTAYCQIISMQNLSNLARLLQSKQRSPAILPKELNLDFLNSTGNISF